MHGWVKTKIVDGNGKSGFSTVPFQWDHGNDICAGTGINPNSREILREVSRGKFPRTAVEKKNIGKGYRWVD